MELEEDSSSIETMELNEHVKKTYVVLTVEDIIARIDDDINTICSAINVSRGAARMLLTTYNWNIVDVTDAWFADQEHALIGDHHTNSAEGVDKFTCSICFTDYSRCNMRSTWCGHLFCENCYKTYIECKVGEGHGCVTIKCPEPNCDAVVLDEMIEKLVSKGCKERFDFYVVRSYVEGKKNIKWCPSPGCDYAVEYELGSEHYDVKCNCSYMFCWNCADEVHSPVDCTTLLAWLSNNKDVSPNYLWIFTNTKPCPKCKKAIEKDKGCMHMICPDPCGHHFCWECLGDWIEHDGNFHTCDVKKRNGWVGGEANTSEPGKLSLVHFSERWALNQCSKDIAKGDLKDWESKTLKEVIEKYGKTELELQFVTEAWLQIIECRRVLKWTYTYAFFMDKENEAKKELFEYLQGEAKAALERLQSCAEKDLEDYFIGGGENHAVKVKVIELTKVTNRFFANLVRALENGLEEVNDSSGGTKLPKKKHADEGSSISRDGNVDDGWVCHRCSHYNLNAAAKDCAMCLLPRQFVKPSFSDSSALGNGLKKVKYASGCSEQPKKYQRDEGSSSSRYANGWNCHNCTYYNVHPAAKKCRLCSLPRE